MKLGRARFFGIFVFAILGAIQFSWASPAEHCLDGNRPLEINNVQVLHWKKNTQNQFEARARVKGTVVGSSRYTTRHTRFIIQIGNRVSETLEVVYNHTFGALPKVRAGTVVEACGDYITSNAHTGRYPPSPAGAIIHWVHFSNNESRHEHGWTKVDGVLYGDDVNEARRHRYHHDFADPDAVFSWTFAPSDPL